MHRRRGGEHAGRLARQRAVDPFGAQAIEEVLHRRSHVAESGRAAEQQALAFDQVLHAHYSTRISPIVPASPRRLATSMAILRAFRIGYPFADGTFGYAQPVDGARAGSRTGHQFRPLPVASLPRRPPVPGSGGAGVHHGVRAGAAGDRGVRRALGLPCLRPLERSAQRLRLLQLLPAS
ncbi:hypothetical protein G6F46_013616 [Rhizopus delemar]|nr:hypothetical protein G6F46_013616 [Rhizopus delemar]